MSSPNILVYTDGSSRGNPGPGGYGIVMQEYDTGYKKEFSKIKNVYNANTIKESLDSSDLVIIHTEWNDFKSINFSNLVKSKKLIIFDMRNIYSPEKIRKQGFKYHSIGR